MIRLLSILILFSFSAQAEYRVYQYIVKNKVSSSPETVDANIKVSTLNPRAYLAYNGGGDLINVELLRTWMCPGRTAGFKDLCPSPYKKLKLEDLQ